MTNELVLPQNTKEVVKQRYDAYHTVALETLNAEIESGTVSFDSEAEKEYAVYHRMLELCAAEDVINDAVKTKVLSHMARTKLYTYAPEGWQSLADVIDEALPSIQSAGYAKELTDVAETIAPYCERAGIDIYDDPTKLGYVREASATLTKIIQSDTPQKAKAAQVKEELRFILGAESRREVRDHYRSWQGEQAHCYHGEIDDEEVLLLVGDPTTIRAIRQNINRQVQNSGKVSVSKWKDVDEDGNVVLKPSKIKGQSLLTQTLHVEQYTTYVLDTETGEVVEEVFQ